MMDVLGQALILAVAFWLGWRLRGLWLIMHLLNRPDLARALAQQAEAALVEEALEPLSLRVEQHGQNLYLYLDTTGQFVGQGASLDQALAAAQAQWPDCKFTIMDQQ